MTMSKISFKVPAELADQIDAHCLKRGIKNKSVFIRHALGAALSPEVEDPELVFSSLKQVHEKLHTLEMQQDILFNFLSFYVRNSFAYHSEIPEELKTSAADIAIQRYAKFYKSFQDNLRNSPSIFESLLADFFEER
jgi:Arc/MetJ-type ribon-helix-helix transcriptional regulator